MTEPLRLEITLDAEPGPQTITGEVAVEGEEPTAFYGWLELIDRVQRAAEQVHPTGT